MRTISTFRRGFFTPVMGAAFAFGLLSCAPTEPRLITPDAPQVERLGRYVQTATGTRFGWPGSGVALQFNGRWLDIIVEDGGAGILDVTLDGVEIAPIVLKAGEHRYRAVARDSTDRASVTITRRTEVFDTGLFTLKGLYTDGRLFDRPKDKEPNILFIGDSITAGFGVRGDTKDCQYNPTTNHPRGAYAALTADVLGADYHLVAISGRGVVHNWDANPMPVMPAQIDFALPDQPDAARWNHSRFMPDVVVSLLGTNDWSVIDPGRDRFRQGYRAMLRDIRARFPDAHIVTVGGPLLDGDKGAAIRDGIIWAMANIDDGNISTLDLTLGHTGVIWSCNSHPGADSMAKMARELAVHIQARTGLPLRNPLPAIASPEALPDDGKAHFTKRVAEIDAAPITEGGVMMIGDSITEGWFNHSEIFPSKTVSNHGVGWDSAAGVRARLPQMLRHSPDAIFIMIGTNDISWGVPPEAVYADLKSAVSQLQSRFPQATIHIQSILPREADKRETIAQMNAQYAVIAEALGVNYVDLSAEFTAPDGTLNTALTDDGLHLSAAGYRVWAEVLKSHLKN